MATFTHNLNTVGKTPFMLWCDMVINEIGYSAFLKKYPTPAKANAGYIQYTKEVTQ